MTISQWVTDTEMAKIEARDRTREPSSVAFLIFIGLAALDLALVALGVLHLWQIFR